MTPVPFNSSQDPQRQSRLRFNQGLFEGAEIRLFLEESQTSVGAIEHVVRQSADNRPCASRHGVRVECQASAIKDSPENNDSRPL